MQKLLELLWVALFWGHPVWLALKTYVRLLFQYVDTSTTKWVSAHKLTSHWSALMLSLANAAIMCKCGSLPTVKPKTISERCCEGSKEYTVDHSISHCSNSYRTSWIGWFNVLSQQRMCTSVALPQFKPKTIYICFAGIEKRVPKQFCHLKSVVLSLTFV